jgi:CheY-like chemotaxis protein
MHTDVDRHEPERRRVGDGSRPPCGRVLVVDRDRDMLGSIKDLLNGGRIVAETADGAEVALEILRRGYAPDVILVDVVTASDEFVELLEFLKEDRATAHIPVVLMSTNRFALEILCSQADGTIQKPFEIDAFSAVLASLCGRDA